MERSENEDLRGSEFIDVNLSETTFRDVSLEDAKFIDVNLANASFEDVSLAGAVIRNANCTGVSIADARYDGMRLDGILVTDLLDRYRSANETAGASTTIRPFRRGDHEAIAEIFPAAVHGIASEVYTEEQCLAWSDREPNPEHWRKRCELKRPWVAVVESRIAGFLELDPDGHIDCAYIHPDFQRQGIMSRLVDHAVATCFAFGIDRVYTEASICAKPMFERCGFHVTKEKHVVIKGVRLLNFHMEKIRQPS